ncbi:hypothetical protein QFC21_000478 [Naganishia friedmannii]|uniref:Uncharacterized protein n=1 Tax=Naganishia friedmannii TaxID=89922 RepID=A0ACC2WBP1_9TREE|nr:hypothetical protein QFC21_000478 [Naganishia friedmannii]
MGIKGLVPYIKKTHPELIKQVPKRWLSPELKGRTVAIDGPLLTSRFFFAAGGQELEDKRMIIGWHALITTMRKAGVKPITVWDVKGERPWKMKEHARRELSRQLHMSRVLHEDQRQVRLEKARRLLEAASRLQKKADRQSMNADDTLSFLSKELESLIKEVQSSSRPSKGHRRRALLEEDESQAEAEIETRGETPVGDSTTKTAKFPGSILADIPAANADESHQLVHQDPRGTPTYLEIPGPQNGDKAIQATHGPMDGDVQYHNEEADAHSRSNGTDESIHEGISVEAVSDSEARASAVESDAAVPDAEEHFMEDKDIRRLLHAEAQRPPEAEVMDTTRRQDSLTATVSVSEGNETGTPTSEEASTVSVTSNDAARVLPVGRLPSEKATNSTGSATTDGSLSANETTGEPGIGPSIMLDTQTGTITNLNDAPNVSTAENNTVEVVSVERSTGEKAERQADKQVVAMTAAPDREGSKIKIASAEDVESRAEEQIAHANVSIYDLVAMANNTGAETSSLEEIATDDIVEDMEIKRALVEPDRDYTESPRQMALTTEEDLQLQDVDLVIRSNTYDQSQITEFTREIDDLAQRARLVSRTYERGHKIPTKWELEECQELMHVMGVPVVLAHPPFEAEGLASAMALAGIADFVGTEDSDVLGYEAPLLRNVATTSKPMEIVEGNVLRSTFNLSPEQFIDFLVLLGTDASSRIPGVGPVRAMKMIQAHDTIEGILDHNEKLRELVGPDYLQEVDAAREVFTVLPPLPRSEDLDIPETDGNAVLDFMRQEHGIDLSTDLRIPYETEGDIELAFDAYQKQSPPAVV